MRIVLVDALKGQSLVVGDGDGFASDTQCLKMLVYARCFQTFTTVRMIALSM